MTLRRVRGLLAKLSDLEAAEDGKAGSWLWDHGPDAPLTPEQQSKLDWLLGDGSGDPLEVDDEVAGLEAGGGPWDAPPEADEPGGPTDVAV